MDSSRFAESSLARATRAYRLWLARPSLTMRIVLAKPASQESLIDLLGEPQIEINSSAPRALLRRVISQCGDVEHDAKVRIGRRPPRLISQWSSGGPARTMPTGSADKTAASDAAMVRQQQIMRSFLTFPTNKQLQQWQL